MKYTADVTLEQFNHLIGVVLKQMGQNIIDFGNSYYTGIDWDNTEFKLSKDEKSLDYFQIYGKGAYFESRQIIFYRKSDHLLELDEQAGGVNHKVCDECVKYLLKSQEEKQCLK